jgi:hypothetical protein
MRRFGEIARRERLDNEPLGYKTTYAHICGEQNDNLPYWAEVDFGDPGIIGVGAEIRKGQACAARLRADAGEVPVGTPPDNLRAMKRAADDFGRY